MSGLDDWIGRRESRHETISERMLAQFRTTFDGFLAPMDVPPGFQWTLVPDLAEAGRLGRDGHPQTGIFVPKLPLPRRMWAGGELEFVAPFAAGDHVKRDSVVTDITFKDGSSGRLGFVTLRHEWLVEGGLRLRERHDIVYREDPKPGTRSNPPKAEEWQADRSVTLTPDPVLLFRYSAMTFNGHRIHYDYPYATEVEGYEGLVVHGPMQAMLMLNMATTMLGRQPAIFRYRGLAPLICGRPIVIEAKSGETGIDMRVRTADGLTTMSALAIA